MKSKNVVRVAQALAGCLVIVLATPSAFAASTWNFGGGCTDPNAPPSSVVANTYTCTSSTLTGTATAWATNGTTTGATFAGAYLSPNGAAGFGVKNAIEGINVTAPDHALDNNGQTDAMLLSFGVGNEISLSSISLGYINTDSDVSVLRYTKTVAPSINGKTISGLLSDGWQLVGSYANLSGSSANAVNSTGLSSSWWLISAYNVGYGTSGAANGTGSAAANFDASADYVKLMSVAGTATRIGGNLVVPEPGTLALAGVAILGMFGARRRKQALR